MKKGRKRIYDDPMGVYRIRLTGAQAIKARRKGDGNVSQGAREYIDQGPSPNADGASVQVPNQSKTDRRCSDRRRLPRPGRATAP